MAFTIYRHLSRTIGPWKQDTFEMYRPLSAAGPFMNDVAEPYCVSKRFPKSAGIKCTDSLCYRDYSVIFFTITTPL